MWVTLVKITMFLWLTLLSLAGIWQDTAAYTCTTSACNCGSYSVTCNIGYRDEIFPVVNGGTGGGSVRLYGNKNITSFPSETFSHGTDVTSLTITGTSITEFACNAFQGTVELNHLNFSNNALKAIPSCALRSALRMSRFRYWPYFDFQDNSIESVQATDFSYLTSVASLNLKNNRISNIGENVFSNLTTLFELNLGNNKLESLSSGLFPTSFSLQTLSLQDNVISTIESTAFETLSGLVTLRLNGNSLQRVDPHWFSTTRILRALHLQDNKITDIEDGALKSLCWMYLLNLSSNSLETLPRLWYNTSCYGVRLQTLDLSNNQISQIHEKAFENLHSLSHLFLSGNQLTTLRREAFNGALNLGTLVLDRNNIQTIEPLAFQGLSILRSLSLADNNLQEITDSKFSQLQNVRYLGLSRNKLAKIDRSAFQGLELLYRLDLTENELNANSMEGLRDSMVHLSELSKLILSGNPLTTLPNDVFESVNLAELFMSNCQLKTIPYESLHPLLSLNYLDISRNAFSNDNQDLSMLTKSSSLYVDVTQNQLTSLNVTIIGASGSFRPKINASVNNLQDVTVVLKAGSSVSLDMYLTDNKLNKPVVIKTGSRTSFFTLNSLDLSGNSFGSLKAIPVDIQVLDSQDIWRPCYSDTVGDVSIRIVKLTLDSNNLKELTKDICLGYVEELRLNNNGIQAILSSIFHHDQFICKTRTISLKGNQLSKLPIATLKQLCSNLRTVNLQGNLLTDLNKLKSLATISSPSVELSGNPIHCGCDIPWLRSSSLMSRLTGARCASPDSAIGYLSNCFPDYICFNRSANESSPRSSNCNYDRYVSMYKLSFVREGNSLKINWAARGPGIIDHFAISSLQERATTPVTVLVPWNLSSTILDGLALDTFRYNICVTARGSKVASGTGIQCSEVDLVPKPIGPNESPQGQTTSPDNKLGIGLGVSFGVGIPAILIAIGVVYYKRRKSSLAGNISINYISTEE